MATKGAAQSTKRGRVDWVALELEYVMGNMTMRELADARSINAATLMAQASKRDWQAKRKQKQAETSKAVESIATDDRIAQQAAQNRADLEDCGRVDG
jgi:restriction endonuclease Mrr